MIRNYTDIQKSIKFVLIYSFIITISISSFAQPSLQKMKEKLSGNTLRTSTSIVLDIVNSTPSQGSLRFSGDLEVERANGPQWLFEQLDLRPHIDGLIPKGEVTIYEGLEVEKLQQYYKGIKVEHGVVSSVGKGGKLAMLQLEFYSLNDDLPVIATLSEQQAFKKALDYVGANKYAWEVYQGSDSNFLKPVGELVIVEDIFRELGKMKLAYKFNIFAVNPLRRSFIYVNANDGDIIFVDDIMKHTNAQTEVNTRYSLSQNITSNKLSDVEYQLAETQRGDNTTIVTANMNYKGLDIDGQIDKTAFKNATDFKDIDNKWKSSTYLDPNKDMVALDVHWAAEKIIDYWWKVHGRKSYNNANSQILNFVHFGTNYNNAAWLGSAMIYGDGNSTNGNKPLASLDVCSHEIGHGVCQTTAQLVYSRESGALNEGFSDIWGACIENYVKNILKIDIGTTKNIWKIGEEISKIDGEGLRDFSNPKLLKQPDTYKGINWRDVTKSYSDGGDDNYGVHYNSGVLNKWFYLLTEADNSGTNDDGFSYNIRGLGFAKSQIIAFATEQILTPNSGFEAARMGSINAAVLLNLLEDTSTIKKSWDAVGVYADSIYNLTNNSNVFLTNNFTAIAVGKWGCIWVGTANQGLYRYDGKKWKKAPFLLDNNIAHIQTDTSGGIWIAQYGKTGAQAIGGGVSYIADSSFENTNYKLYNEFNGLPNRNVRSLFINNRTPINPTSPYYRVWAAHLGDLNAGMARTGAVGRGTNLLSPPFKSITKGVETTNGLGSCQNIGGSLKEVWVFALNNFGGNQILRYDISTDAFIDSFRVNYTSKAIYYDTIFKRWWIGTLSNGIKVYDEPSATWMDVPSAVIPTTTFVNNNAITGDKNYIYFGTSTGLIRYTNNLVQGQNGPQNEGAYRKYTMADGLPSNNIKAICVDTLAGRVLLATDNGLAFRYFLQPENVTIIYSIRSGNWNDPTIWSNNEVPNATSHVNLKHVVLVTANTSCKTLEVQAEGGVTLGPGVNLKIISQ